MPLSRFLLILFTATLAISTAQAAEKLVTVTGEATVAVPPDTAVIRIGVSSLEKTAREAGEANAKQMTAVLAAIKASGIAERDIQTSRLSLQPQYDPNKGRHCPPHRFPSHQSGDDPNSRHRQPANRSRSRHRGGSK